ncbi:MAG: hypothetical protein IJ629_00590 [Clostridia bacterium]|nr:hypothetical protein [Clostridia bacterium]
MNKKITWKERTLAIIIISLILLITLSGECFAADPTLITKLKSAFEKIQGYILRLATPVAAVSVGVGALMRKFSFGDEEKIRTGKNLIRGSIVSYIVILLTDMILSLINTLLG